MMSNSKKIGLFLLITGMLSTQASFAQEGKKSHAMGKEFCMSAVNLTAEQKNQLKEMRDNHKKSWKAEGKNSDRKARAETLVNLLKETNFDEAKVKAWLASDERLEHQLNEIKLRHSMFQMLTPEQRDIVSQCMLEHSAKAKKAKHYKAE